MEQNTTPGQDTREALAVPDKARIREVGNFEIISKLGQGGMGAVYKARQKSLDRIVALKVLPPAVAKKTQFIERFQGEARASAKLNHINIVKGIDVGQDSASGLWFFAMEFVDGPSLQQVLKKEGALEEKRALKIVSEIASALECVAEAGMVHRDIKPDNILLNSDGNAKLADLGLAKDLHDDAGLTLSGQALGTPNYMAPEQARGELTQLDIRTDIYSLGATLFHLVTGQPPFTGETSAVIMTKHLTQMPAKANTVNPAVSSGCTKLIERMMQKKKEQRVQTPGEIIKLIAKILAGEDIGKGMATGSRDNIAPHAISRGRLGVAGKTAPTQTQSRIPLMGIFAGGAALVAVLLTAFLMSSGHTSADTGQPPNPSGNKGTATTLADGTGNPQPSKTNKSPSASQLESDKNNPEKLVAFAQAYEKKNPEAYDEVLAKYYQALQVLKRSPDNQKSLTEVQSAIERVKGRHAAAATEAWSAIETSANATAKTGDYDAALTALTTVPKQFSKALAEKVSAKASSLRSEGESKLLPIIEQAEQLAKNGDPASGLKQLATVAHIRLNPLSTRAMNLKAQLEVATRDLDKNRKDQIANQKLEQYLNRFDQSIIVDKDPQTARKTIEMAGRDSAIKSASSTVSAMSALMTAYDDALEVQRNALKELKGKPFVVAGRKGTIEKVEEGLIHVSISMDEGKMIGTAKVPVKDLTSEQRNGLFQIPPPKSAAEKVVAAMLKLSKDNEDIVGALALLDSAGDFALAGRYRDIIRIRQVGVKEAAAEKAWSIITQAGTKPCDTVAQGKALLAVVDGYLAEHGPTQFAQGKSAELTALRDKANSVVDVKVFLSDLQELEVKVGYPKFGKNGDLGYEGQTIRVYGVASPKGISTHPATNGNSHVAYMLDKKYSYFSTHVAINDSCGVNGNITPIVFKVYGDGKLLWQSKPVQRSRQNPQPPTEECLVDVSGVQKLQLMVECPGSYGHAHAVWLEPRLGTAKIKK